MSAFKSKGLKRMLDEELEGYGEGVPNDDDLLVAKIVFSVSSESLGASSQDYSQCGDDITDLILAYHPTQPASAEGPPDSATSSDVSLGKRKASDQSSTSSVGPFRSSKIPRLVPPADDNPFESKPIAEAHAEDPYAPICISPSHSLQRIFTNKKVPYGVQYEIARYVSLDKINYGDVYIPNLDKLASLHTNQEAVPATAKSILSGKFLDDDDNDDCWNDAFAKERAAKSPWMELDREENALRNNPYGGLGFNEDGEYQNWYGGRVLFRGKLQDVSPKGDKRPKYKITLEPAELGPSYMFARRFGSKNFFRLKLTKPVMNRNTDLLLDYLRRPLILCGSTFRAFYAKESNVFYVKTNEKANGESLIPNATIDGVLSFHDFLEWHNPMHLNNNQTMAKYVSRFALGLSNSVPGIMVNQNMIVPIDDIVSRTGSNMTDGAGKINRWSLKQIRHRLDWDDTPTAIQTRIFGTKGLLVDDGKNAEESPYVEITPSQQKIRFQDGQPIDLAHRIVDVLRSSHTKSPCRLSIETIMCLADGGVGKSVFLELLKKSLKDLIEPLLDWDCPDAMRILWSNVCRLGGVMAARRGREEAGLARVKGYSERESEEIELEDEDGFTVDITEQRSVAWWSDEISGCPSSLEETIMYMLDSGFTPQQCPILQDKLHKFIKARVNSYIKSYRIDVPMSASAFLVPDTSGVLAPGEIFFKSSRRHFLLEDGTESDIFVGDVLVTRHPCKLPTDIQKWKSVDRPELHHLTDVIILSTKGDRRQADLLAGGDFDGDKGIVISQPEIVKAFSNAPLNFADPPADINSNFARENVQVATFQKDMENLSNDYSIRLFQKYLLGAVCNTSVVGKYSIYHENAIYTLGYRDPETIRLAYMFCMTLDGIKTGMTVLKSVLQADSHKFQKRSPEWKEATTDEREYFESNETNLKRPPALGQFIMDDLYKQTHKQSDLWLTHIEKHFKSNTSFKADSQLAGPWTQAKKRVERWISEENNHCMESELQRLMNHVENIYDQHRNEMSSPRKASKMSPKKGGASFTDLPIEVRQDKIRDLSKKFASFPPPDKFLTMSEEETASIRASYAYVYDQEQRARYGANNFTRFPWDVGMRELCAIKSRALGRSKTISGEFYDHFNMKHTKQHHF